MNTKWAIHNWEGHPGGLRDPFCNPSNINSLWLFVLNILLCIFVRRQAALAAMMMELSHSLTLNEEALQQIPPAKRPLFIFEWLRFLDKVLVAAQKVIRNWGSIIP